MAPSPVPNVMSSISSDCTLHSRSETDPGHRRGSLLLTVLAVIVLLGLSLCSLLLSVASSTPDLSAAYVALAAEGALVASLVLVKFGRSGIYILSPSPSSPW